MTPMSVSALARNPTPELDLRMYLEMHYVGLRVPLEALAGLIGVELDGPLPPLQEDSLKLSPSVTAALSAMHGALGYLTPTSPILGYRYGCAVEMADWLAVLAQYEPAILDAEKAEAAAILGRVIDDEIERDQALEDYALDADVSRDAALVRFFHRRVARRQALLGTRYKLFKRQYIQEIG
jgi:hypothetical protein